MNYAATTSTENDESKLKEFKKKEKKTLFTIH